MFVFGLVAVFVGCSSSKKEQYVTLGTAPVGGAFAPVGNAIASVANEFKGDHEWKVQAQGTKGSQQNIRMLDKGEIQLGMSNSAISYAAARGTGSWDKKYDIRAVVTLAPNVGLFITKKNSGIESLADLKDKRITVGPAGAGFEMFLGPLLTAHGVNYGTGDPAFTPMNETYSAAVQLLGDDNADAAFMGGAVPTPAVTQACTSYDISFIPYDESVRQELIKEYEFYQPVTIPAKNKDGKPTYKGLESDFQALNVGSMQLITNADVDEELVYQLTKTIWENRKEIAKQHRAANAINEQNAARYTGTEFHPGAIRFYKEIGIWPEESTEPASDPSSQDVEPAGTAE
jgi:TRAP transporter TAXI family solute receptor